MRSSSGFDIRGCPQRGGCPRLYPPQRGDKRHRTDTPRFRTLRIYEQIAALPIHRQLRVLEFVWLNAASLRTNFTAWRSVSMAFVEHRQFVAVVHRHRPRAVRS